MAQIVLGLGTSHSPQLSTPPDLWRNHGERDKRNPDLRKPDGRVTPTKRCSPLRVHLSRKNSPQTRGKGAMLPARRASHKWALH